MVGRSVIKLERSKQDSHASFQTSDGAHRHAFLHTNTEESTFPHQPKAGGFETTDCLECLQILDVLYMAGRSALKLEIGYCVPWLAILFQNGKRAACFPFVELLHSYDFWPYYSCNLQGLHGLENLIRFLLSKDKVLSLLATSLLNRNPYGFPINGSPVF